MVRLSSALGLAALVSCTVAAPAAATGFQRSAMEMEMEARDTGTGFSFETWVNGIIADPEGDHLSPAEAVAAAQDAAVLGNCLALEKRSGDLTARESISCNDSGKPKASLQDASDAISQLARRGNANCHIPYAGGASLVKYGLAEIYGVTVNKHGSILPW
ncbi:hypothetical protein ASPCAL10802 [Aspergillus calidoustus]|uniref:Uncharacterized protein n=1 Tax=Aspergillus calidoustus TaxID=454130 RepID=A0A0U5G9N3_ASPCI|nr:hypothetical protein ASPCAL10802 [Aspergillus calidoustus]